VRYDATVVVTHATRATLPSWWRQRHDYGRSAARLAELHPGRLAPVRADAWTLAAWSAILARQPRVAAGVIAGARRLLEEQLPASLDDRATVANLIAVRNMAGAGGPIARNIVRSYGPLVLAAAVAKKTRPIAVIVFATGTLWRWHDRDERRLADLPWAVVDDLAYASGLWRGAIERRSPAVVIPQITGSIKGLARALRPGASGT
jgi:predicted hotdog family 3-hydroxylacyl-ACP dehydratase